MIAVTVTVSERMRVGRDSESLIEPKVFHLKIQFNILLQPLYVWLTIEIKDSIQRNGETISILQTATTLLKHS